MMADPIIDLLHFAGKLGTRLAELHAVLAQPCDDPAFAPEHMTDADCLHLAQSVRQQLDKALTLLHDTANPGRRRRHAFRAVVSAERGTRRIDRPPCRIQATGALRTRIHGDFHLGQVLVVGRRLSARFRRRTGNARWNSDARRIVRGAMLPACCVPTITPPTSLPIADCPISVKSRRRTPPENPAPLCAGIARAFLDAYCACGGQDCRSDALLDLFTLEKASYEVCYEAANRPTWLAVPRCADWRELVGSFAAHHSYKGR
jgi:maltose alpha-D-glucosyltransferase/alpha-amylase